MATEKQRSRTPAPAEEPLPVTGSPNDGLREPEESGEKHEARDGEEDDLERQRPDLHHASSHISTHDAPVFLQNDHYEHGDEIYDRLSPHRKIAVVCVLSGCSFLAPISSTSILAAAPEVVSTFHTTGTIFNLSNALYMVFMGLSPLFWGPIGQTYGRKWPLAIAAVTFTAFSAGSAAAPNLATYFVMRMLTAFQGTTFLSVGATVIGDIYRPVERGTAYGWFLSGTLIGPALGPFIGGIIVTFATWRDIFWLQTALAGVSSLAVVFLIPETIHHARKADLVGLTRKQQARKLWSWINPWRVIVLFRYPNLLIAGVASSSLVWNMYSLLTPIRYVLNPRFGLTSPLQSGLFYIAPGCGYLLGTFFGGRWADHVVKKWIKRRGHRVPEDRLRSCLVAMGVVLPACMIVYGWSIEKEVGGIPLPVIVMFLQGVAQLFCFPSLNTYCLDVMQENSAEVVAGNYVIRYMFAAAGSAACLPVIERIGVGWFSTISAGFLIAAAVATWFTAQYGGAWREAIDAGKQEDG
ncbi:hypothetical protein LTR53_006941 [Teratosphaeriaceae sp. CCFEE 6253]|nr:hypothetical protein LTR53_006941 [Teratosphaeriaceae sp. CCFEE 6253]